MELVVAIAFFFGMGWTLSKEKHKCVEQETKIEGVKKCVKQ